jgi:hypothetical protein
MDSKRSASGVARRAAVAMVALISVVAGGVGTALTAAPARAATAHRAAVVVYVDGAVHTAKITFTSDSISGIDALNDAGFVPLVRVFGGNGGAVCALEVGGTTIGCPADNSCLTCSEASDYWAYFRALAGETSYTYSRAGAGSTEVRDGGVEAWAWGTGATPTPFVSFASVWGSGDPPPTTRPTPPPTRPTNTTQPTPPKSSPSTVGALGTVPTVESRSVPPSSGSLDLATAATAKPSTTKASGPGSSEPPTSTARADDGSGARRVATAPIVARGNGGSPYGIIGFVAVLALLVAAIVFARRRRSPARHTPT